MYMYFLHIYSLGKKQIATIMRFTYIVDSGGYPILRDMYEIGRTVRYAIEILS